MGDDGEADVGGRAVSVKQSSRAGAERPGRRGMYDQWYDETNTTTYIEHRLGRFEGLLVIAPDLKIGRWR